MQHGGEKPEGRQAPTHRGKRGHGSSQQELLASPTATRCHPTEPPLSSREAAPNQRVQSLHTSIHRQAGTDRAWRSCCFPAWIPRTIRRGEPPYFTALTARRSHELRERKRRHAAHGRGHLGREAAISGRRLVPAAPGPPPPARRPAPLRSPPPGPAAARWLPGAGAAGGIRRGLPSSPAHVEESRSAAAPPPPGAAPHRGRPQHGPGVARRERTLRPPRRLRHSPSRSRARCGPPRGGGTAAGRGAAGEGKRQRGAPAPGALVGQRAASVMGAGRAGGARHSGAWSPPALPAPRREAAAAEGGGLRLPESAAPLGLGRDERRAAAVPLGRSRPSSSLWKGSVRGSCGRCAGPSGTLGAGPAAGGRQAG